jgi:hypothetical protein
MKKNILRFSCFCFGFLIIASCTVTKQGKDKPVNKGVFDCGQMIGFEERLKTDAQFRDDLEALEKQTAQYIGMLKERNNTDFRSTVVTIPVVVHVVNKNAAENVSDAQIQSEIDALNNIYRMMNADVSTVPSPFNGLAADIMVQFTLAQRDPNCQATNGITRTSTTVSSFNNAPTAATPQTRNAVKFTASGGRDGWPSDRYLNLWVCDLAGGLIGYASFPSDLAARPTEDGVVMDFMGFGTIGSLYADLNLGRVCTHEVGHWLNLRHIWADENDCTGSDFVDDTPNQQGNNTGCPGFPRTDLCSATSPGVMFMNQMDYTNDACRRMFTIGQSDRMAATLFTLRSSILSSQGAIPPPASASADLWMKDTDEDLGNEPNNESGTFYISDDIWVRNSNDGLVNQESQAARGGSLNYAYVKIRNKGCNASASGSNLKLYWAKASAGLNWPQPWDGSVTLGGTSTLMGNLIGTKPVGVVAGDGFQIYEFQWNAPDPSDYASLGADLPHFCLLARIEEPAGMAIAEVPGDLGGNVKRNNNIVWKNIAVSDVDGSGFSAALISNYTKKEQYLTIAIDGSKTVNPKDFLEKGGGILYAKFDGQLTELIAAKAVKVKGLQKTDNNMYIVENGLASIFKIRTDPGQQFVVQLKFVPGKRIAAKRYVYKVFLNQYDARSNNMIGGMLFKFKKSK